MFAEFQLFVDNPGLSYVGGIICPQASQTCCDKAIFSPTKSTSFAASTSTLKKVHWNQFLFLFYRFVSGSQSASNWGSLSWKTYKKLIFQINHLLEDFFLFCHIYRILTRAFKTRFVVPVWFIFLYCFENHCFLIV